MMVHHDKVPLDSRRYRSKTCLPDHLVLGQHPIDGNTGSGPQSAICPSGVSPRLIRVPNLGCYNLTLLKVCHARSHRGPGCCYGARCISLGLAKLQLRLRSSEEPRHKVCTKSSAPSSFSSKLRGAAATKVTTMSKKKDMVRRIVSSFVQEFGESGAQRC
ncbi:hypothetical protein BC834DRAFT_609306 [Gloeopeniophorella convolvens]|nr:hypothetical protein BC834DRAFT_609306 [Gloeopeniophorella convolvens]